MNRGIPQIRLMYKIHALNTANKLSRSAGNDTFYEDLENAEGTGALDKAREYVNNQTMGNTMVIYKAYVLVRKSRPPVEVIGIRHDGTFIPLR